MGTSVILMYDVELYNLVTRTQKIVRVFQKAALVISVLEPRPAVASIGIPIDEPRWSSLVYDMEEAGTKNSSIARSLRSL